MLDDSAQEEKEEELCSKLQLFSTSPGSRSPGVCWESFQATGVGVLQHHRRFLIFCTIFWTIHVLLSCVFQSCHFCSFFFALITFFSFQEGVWGRRRLLEGFSYSSQSFVQYRFYYHVFFNVVIFVFCFSHWSQFDSFQEGVWGRRRSLELTRLCGDLSIAHIAAAPG